MTSALRIKAPENFPKKYAFLMEGVNLLTEGVGPQFWINDQQEVGAAFVDDYTLFPGVVIPHRPEIEWTEEEWYKIAFGLVHLIQSLKKVPELNIVSHATTAQYKQIANDINQSITKFFIEKYLSSKGITPFDLKKDFSKDIQKFLQNISSDTLPELIKFRALQIKLRKRLKYEFADQAWKLLDDKYHDCLINAEETAKKLDNITNINDPLAKIEACDIVLDYLEFPKNEFKFIEYQISEGKKRPLDYNFYTRALKRIEDFKKDDHENRIVVSFTLPFKIPANEGVYKSKDYRILLEHIPSFHPLAPWQKSQNVEIESQYDQHGLYEFSQVQISLNEKVGCEDNETPPPSDIHYEIYKSYPKYCYEIVKVLNEFINFLKTKNQKTVHIQPINLLHLSQHSIQKITNGTEDFPTTKNLELVKVSVGSPLDKKNILTEIQEVPFYEVLLNEAKRHMIETDPRRAILDLYTSFENFINLCLKTKIKEDLNETVKEKFLRLYGLQIPEYIETIKKIKDTEKKENCPATIRRIVKKYQEYNIKPIIYEEQLKIMLSLGELRNKAAHGGDMDLDCMDKISDGIKAMEQIISNYKS